MRANRRRPVGSRSRVVGLCASLAFAFLGCGGSTPMDQWINKDPDAGAGFEVPVRESVPRNDGGADAGDDSAPDTSGSDDATTATDDAAADTVDTDATTD